MRRDWSEQSPVSIAFALTGGSKMLPGKSWGSKKIANWEWQSSSGGEF